MLGERGSTRLKGQATNLTVSDVLTVPYCKHRKPGRGLFRAGRGCLRPNPAFIVLLEQPLMVVEHAMRMNNEQENSMNLDLFRWWVGDVWRDKAKDWPSLLVQRQ